MNEKKALSHNHLKQRYDAEHNYDKNVNSSNMNVTTSTFQSAMIL